MGFSYWIVGAAFLSLCISEYIFETLLFCSGLKVAYPGSSSIGLPFTIE
jgi:hypothetical protein